MGFQQGVVPCSLGPDGVFVQAVELLQLLPHLHFIHAAEQVLAELHLAVPFHDLQLLLADAGILRAGQALCRLRASFGFFLLPSIHLLS